MILDRLENKNIYRPISDEIAVALDYLGKTDFSALPTGRQEIDGDRIYAVVLRYQPKTLAEAKAEAHRRYIDVQFVAKGIERMGYANLRPDLPECQPYNADKDCVLFDTIGDLLEVTAGSFAIFWPQDVHTPCIAPARPEDLAEVVKVVVKCRVS
jgi:biofilm protein TabA